MHHGSTDREHSSNVALSYTVGMMGTRCSLRSCLAKGLQVVLVFMTRERRSFISEISLGNYTMFGAFGLKAGLCFKSLLRVESDLQMNMNVATGMIHKDASTLVLADLAHVAQFSHVTDVILVIGIRYGATLRHSLSTLESMQSNEQEQCFLFWFDELSHGRLVRS